MDGGMHGNEEREVYTESEKGLEESGVPVGGNYEIFEGGYGYEDVDGYEAGVDVDAGEVGGGRHEEGYGVDDDDDDDDGYEEGDGDKDGHDDGTKGGVDSFIEDGIKINGLVDILNIDMKNIRTNDVSRFDLADLHVAHSFYSWYGRLNGFSVRKSRLLRSSKGEILQQTFVCSREGFREDRGVPPEMRRREQRNYTRCGCDAKFRVHVDSPSGRWYVSLFMDDHNHELLEEVYCAMLPAHRKLTAADVLQIENSTKVGIRVPQIYGSFANTAGGYHKIRFRKKDIYNQMARQRRKRISDASGAVKYLKELRLKDPLMFVAHTVDVESRLQHLFWCDGESRKNYEIFGDVLAFDATYRKNKYKCPLVIFSGVNHHNQTIVFATALMANETEETYVWLLEQFLVAMNGKTPSSVIKPPSSVITDGDVAMKNAIVRVFPQAHHRLCAWHLLRNATINVGIPGFLPRLKKCMLGDHDVLKFEQLWEEMVVEFGLEDNTWIRELYERKKMWATAHIRGNFFAGIRTTSRCEAFHSHVLKFVNPRINFTEFVQQFHRCLTYFRFREVEADFQSQYGDVVLQKSFRSLERSASQRFTKEIFLMFRQIVMLFSLVLTKVSLIKLIDSQEMSMYTIYTVSKYPRLDKIWRVTYCPAPVEFRCSCLRMESMGIPCDHIVMVLVYLGFTELPKCLVLDRWSIHAKEAIRATYHDGSLYWDSFLIARYASLVDLCRQLSDLASRDETDYQHVVDVVLNELNVLKLKYNTEGGVDNSQCEIAPEILEDPPTARSKGCGTSRTSGSGKGKRTQKCGACGVIGHNRRSCPGGRVNEQPTDSTAAYSLDAQDDVV